MTVQAEWYNEEKTIIRIHAHDPWAIDEYSWAVQHAWSLIESVENPVHIIIDFTDVRSFPRNLLSAAPTTNKHIHPRQRLVVAVNISPYLQTMMRVAIRVFPRLGQNLLFAQNLQDAYDLIQKHSTSTIPSS